MTIQPLEGEKVPPQKVAEMPVRGWRFRAAVRIASAIVAVGLIGWALEGVAFLFHSPRPAPQEKMAEAPAYPDLQTVCSPGGQWRFASAAETQLEIRNELVDNGAPEWLKQIIAPLVALPHSAEDQSWGKPGPAILALPGAIVLCEKASGDGRLLVQFLQFDRSKDETERLLQNGGWRIELPVEEVQGGWRRLTRGDRGVWLIYSQSQPDALTCMVVPDGSSASSAISQQQVSTQP